MASPTVSLMPTGAFKTTHLFPRATPGDLNDLDGYIYSYLAKKQYISTAEIFLKEAGDRVKSAPLEWQSDQSLLSDWWSLLWDILKTPQEFSNKATSLIEALKVQRSFSSHQTISSGNRNSHSAGPERTNSTSNTPPSLPPAPSLLSSLTGPTNTEISNSLSSSKWLTDFMSSSANTGNSQGLLTEVMNGIPPSHQSKKSSLGPELVHGSSPSSTTLTPGTNPGAPSPYPSPSSFSPVASHSNPSQSLSNPSTPYPSFIPTQPKLQQSSVVHPNSMASALTQPIMNPSYPPVPPNFDPTFLARLTPQTKPLVNLVDLPTEELVKQFSKDVIGNKVFDNLSPAEQRSVIEMMKKRAADTQGVINRHIQQTNQRNVAEAMRLQQFLTDNQRSSLLMQQPQRQVDSRILNGVETGIPDDFLNIMRSSGPQTIPNHANSYPLQPIQAPQDLPVAYQRPNPPSLQSYSNPLDPRSLSYPEIPRPTGVKRKSEVLNEGIENSKRVKLEREASSELNPMNWFNPSMLSSALSTRENSSEPLKQGNTPPKDFAAFQITNSPKDSLLVQAAAASATMSRSNTGNALISGGVNNGLSPQHSSQIPNLTTIPPPTHPNASIKPNGKSTPSGPSPPNRSNPPINPLIPPSVSSLNNSTPNFPPSESVLELLNLTGTGNSNGLGDSLFSKTHHASCTNHDHTDPCDVHEQMKIQNLQDSHVFRVTDMDTLDWGEFPDFTYGLSSF